MAERYGLEVPASYKDNPVYKLFVRNREQPVDYNGDYSFDDLRLFVATEAGERGRVTYRTLG